VLEKKRAAHKELKSMLREKGSKRLIKKAKAYVAARRKSQEAKKEAKMAKAEQQGEEAEKAESSEADPAVAEWIGRDRKERCIKRIVRERHIKERLGWRDQRGGGGRGRASVSSGQTHPAGG
jgi:hypothetical protein